MPKPRSKRLELREQKRRMLQQQEYQNESRPSKRQRNDGPEEAKPGEMEEDERKEFFGMLADEEQEYFRRADEMLELNQFQDNEERDMFLQNVYKEAEGKELKLACSQSCSRLMERLILLSTSQQKKHLFEQFAGHFYSLVQHRFASHCCETLFLQSASVVTKELGNYFFQDTAGSKTGEEQKSQQSMEQLFLYTLDELEQELSFLLTDKFASHTLRVLLVVLSGRPIENAATKSLIQSKRKEKISVPGAGASTESSENTQLRAVPESFTMATKKIIADATASMDQTTLKVMAKHPTGNPLLQMLLELDISMNPKVDNSVDGEKNREPLLSKLLPDAPTSLSDNGSKASNFVNELIFDTIGSRLLETLITHCPAKIFKGLYSHIYLPRLGTYVRNDVASYSVIRILNRLGKDDLVEATQKIIPEFPKLIAKPRFNVIKVLYERSQARHVPELANDITSALLSGYRGDHGGDAKLLIPKLCGIKAQDQLSAEDKLEKKVMEQYTQNVPATLAHGAQLASAMLSSPGPASEAVQESLLALSSDQLVQLASQSTASVNVLITAFSVPAGNPMFHKALLASLIQHMSDLSQSQFGHNLVNTIIAIPSVGKDRSIPFHLKERILAQLAENEGTLRDSWTGRSVWRTWKGDLWKHRRAEWARWAKEVDATVSNASKPWLTAKNKGKANSKFMGGRNKK
jgi:nucleolar protein 9